MKKLLLLIIFAIAYLGNAFALDLKSGDVILISFNCHECKIIESETNSQFSHSGVILLSQQNTIQVAQSLGSVSLYSLEQFLKNKTPGTLASVYRPKQFLEMDSFEEKKLEQEMRDVFKNKFQAAPFDELYLWDNYDHNGRELLYCSEFIAKFLDQFLNQVTIPYVLTYNKNYDYWFKYFDGVVPVGVLGNSPASFSKDPRFTFIGNL